jgi:hypothetical protein
VKTWFQNLELQIQLVPLHRGGGGEGFGSGAGGDGGGDERRGYSRGSGDRGTVERVI